MSNPPKIEHADFVTANIAARRYSDGRIVLASRSAPDRGLFGQQAIEVEITLPYEEAKKFAEGFAKLLEDPW